MSLLGLFLFVCKMNIYGRSKGYKSRAAARASTYKGRQDVTGIIGNTVLVHSGFHKHKLLLRSQKGWPALSNAENVGFKWWKFIKLPRVPNCLPGRGAHISHSALLTYIPLLINPLKPTVYVMHRQFNIQQLYALPTLYLCVLYLSENKQRLVPLTA